MLQLLVTLSHDLKADQTEHCSRFTALLMKSMCAAFETVMETIDTKAGPKLNADNMSGSLDS